MRQKDEAEEEGHQDPDHREGQDYRGNFESPLAAPADDGDEDDDEDDDEDHDDPWSVEL